MRFLFNLIHKFKRKKYNAILTDKQIDLLLNLKRQPREKESKNGK